MARAAGWDLCSGSAANRNVIYQDLSWDAIILAPHSFTVSTWSPQVESYRVHQWSLWGETEVGLLGSALQCEVSWMFTLDSLFLPLENPQVQGGPFSAVLCWPGEQAMCSDCSHSCHSSSAVFPCLWVLASLRVSGISQWCLVYE